MKEKTFHRHYGPFSANTRSKLCKIQSETAVLRELESNVIENEVRAWKGRTVKICHRPYRAFSCKQGQNYAKYGAKERY